jgi:cell division protease FtsH
MAGSEFMEMLVGVGSARMRDLFNTAKKSAPAIIFIDEVESIGRARSQFGASSHDEREQTLNQMLVEMDGFTPNDNVIVIAATNRPDLLDTALLRPGRFDRRVVLDMPDVDGRRDILKIHARNKLFVEHIDWDRIARRTVGFSGADLENMLNEAAIGAARENKKAIDMKDLEEAATRVKLGPMKKRIQTDEEKKMTAYHEAGHALVSYAMPHMDPVHRISIVSRGMTLGHTLIPPGDRVQDTKTHLMEQIATMLGGRVAEEIVFHEKTSGASNDIEKATEVARSMVVELGMSDLGAINFAGGSIASRAAGDATPISPEMAAKIDDEIKQILDEGYKMATVTLTKLRKKLKRNS